MIPTSGGSKPQFSIAVVYDTLWLRQSQVLWHNRIWFSGHIPHASFVCWMALLDMLPTKTRMRSWFTSLSLHCQFYSDEEESQDHIFFSCSVAGNIWRRIITYLHILYIPRDYASELTRAIANRRGQTSDTFLLQVNFHDLYIFYMVGV